MEGSCSTGQSPQRAVVPVEEEKEYCCNINCAFAGCNKTILAYSLLLYEIF
jgi:hypothetical protein